jgi:hypothetical protein
MIGRLGASAKLAQRVISASPCFRRPGSSVGLRLSPFSNVPAQKGGSDSRDLPTPWAPKHPQLGKSPQDMVSCLLLAVSAVFVRTNLTKIADQ